MFEMKAMSTKELIKFGDNFAREIGPKPSEDQIHILHTLKTLAMCEVTKRYILKRKVTTS